MSFSSADKTVSPSFMETLYPVCIARGIISYRVGRTPDGWFELIFEWEIGEGRVPNPAAIGVVLLQDERKFSIRVPLVLSVEPNRAAEKAVGYLRIPDELKPESDFKVSISESE
jgi:hypothetical protein